ncbi:MAG: hypothetical protein AAFX93_02420 [Verrucomicrobiota bacterium]
MSRIAKISILVISVAIPVGIGVFIASQKEPTPESSEQAPPETPAPPVEVAEIDPAPVPEPPPKPTVAPERPKPAPAPIPPKPSPKVDVLERYEVISLIGADGRNIEAQILDIVDGEVTIRRADSRIFEVPSGRFDSATRALLRQWENAYAHLVSPDQKEFLSRTEDRDRLSQAPGFIDRYKLSDLPAGPQAEGIDAAVKWRIVDNMSDEFEGTELDSEKWQAEPKGNGWNWIGRPPGLFTTDTIKVDDGKMKITVRELDEPTTIRNHEFLYEGAIVRSHHAGQPGWFFECKMKANATEMSSTFWLMTKGATIKKLELDVQECVGTVSELAEQWAKDWDQIFHSNMIHRENKHNPEKLQLQNSVPTETKNHERYYIYGVWWKSTSEALFYLDGKHVYTINPKIEWDVPAYLQMAIETYDWNPVPPEGNMIERGNEEERTTSYEWIRVWESVTEES